MKHVNVSYVIFKACVSMRYSECLGFIPSIQPSAANGTFVHTLH